MNAPHNPVAHPGTASCTNTGMGASRTDAEVSGGKANHLELTYTGGTACITTRREPAENKTSHLGSN